MSSLANTALCCTETAKFESSI